MSADDRLGTGSFSRYHLETTGAINSLQTRADNAEKDIEALQKKMEVTAEKAAHADGYVEGSIPDLQRRLENAFNMLGESEETANVYYSQIRELSKEVEQLRTSLNKKATEEGLKNCFLWVKGGFIAVAIAFLLWVLALWGGFLGIRAKSPTNSPAVGAQRP